MKSLFSKLGDFIFAFMVRSGLVAPLVTLLRPYGGYSQGQTVGLSGSTEAALIAAGQATVGTTVTPGALSTNQTAGVCAVAAGASSVVITNPLIIPQSNVSAVISQAAADATATQVVRVVCGTGTLTIHVNAAATAATQVSWAMNFGPTLSLPN